MNNRWNRLIYKGWSPIYERIFNSGMFLQARKLIFRDITFKQGSKVLLVGVGTGADLPYFLNKGCQITAIDYSLDMLNVAKERYKDSSINFLQMDAQHLAFEDDSFDFVVASLILSVVPDPKRSLIEIVRVLKKNSSFIVFDKFVTSDKKPSIKQKILRPLIKFLGTDIGLDFYDLFKVVEDRSEIILDEKIMMNGLYRKIVGVKQFATSE
ncbi:class I SAM-dependent methyltransferase [Mesobacillus maritimus]|uniref:class I SAM-dependent methyltransferase n=1 Tax=Mesobacillus maritimus TaxID=1643336 RepID=UPI00203DED6A|nr:class I SAM-dependent methyltransferase [Mesobacillus maritimus]MCM3669003.1 class I SAM-dependent methyltransferase [Mesobacillus maritimus]